MDSENMRKTGKMSASANARKHGNMLAMVALVGLVIAAVLGIGIVVSMMMMSQKRTQSKIETLSLAMATAINKDDWVGEMNNMTEFSRELVHTSRTVFNATNERYTRMKPLATLLLEEARQSALLVESERKDLTVLLLKDLQKMTSAAENQKENQTGMKLPGVSADATQLKTVDAGYIDGVLSNLTSADGLPELRDYDLQEKYITPKSFVYLSNINAKLPAPDDDLNFQICSLASPSKKSIAPVRLTSNSVFKKLMTVGPEVGNDFSKCKQLPSAVQVVSSSKISGVNQLQDSMSVTISAAAQGAGLKLP
jgi:hypothetical protein